MRSDCTRVKPVSYHKSIEAASHQIGQHPRFFRQLTGRRNKAKSREHFGRCQGSTKPLHVLKAQRLIAQSSCSGGHCLRAPHKNFSTSAKEWKGVRHAARGEAILVGVRIRSVAPVDVVLRSTSQPQYDNLASKCRPGSQREWMQTKHC